MIYLVKLI